MKLAADPDQAPNAMRYALCAAVRHSYSGTGYANPDAITQLANGLSTTTFQYDNDGNVVQKTVDGTTTTYVWDYANRLTALGGGGATTTYGYDAFGTRVLQTGTSTTTIYPFKWYSVASSTGTGAKYSTTTDYLFNGETLVSTVDQQFAGGIATGTPVTHYIHPDHLGSTNVVTDASGTVVETTDYYPYGGTRIDTGSNALSRKYVGQFADISGLDYLQARYQDPQRGQFISQDPTFLALGDPDQLQQLAKQSQQQFLSDPQQMNAYSYAEDNPITRKDPNGRNPLILGGAIAGVFYGIGQQLEYDLTSGQTSSVPTYIGAGLIGAGQGAATAASLVYLGPVTSLEYYGYYQSYQGLRDFNEQILSNNSINYTEQQQRMTAGVVWLDASQRIASAFTPMPIRAAYDAITSILYSLIQISNQFSALQNAQSANANSKAQTGSAATAAGQSVNSGGGGGGYGSPGSIYTNYVPGNSHTACGKLCN
jgi:RHS repeat-associated protein